MGAAQKKKTHRAEHLNLVIHLDTRFRLVLELHKDNHHANDSNEFDTENPKMCWMEMVGARRVELANNFPTDLNA